MNWYVKHFSDYHEIESSTHRYIELGCFPVGGEGCCRYFGLFYKGRKPSFEKVLNSVLKKVSLGSFNHYRSNEDIGITKEELVDELKESFKLKGQID